MSHTFMIPGTMPWFPYRHVEFQVPFSLHLGTPYFRQFRRFLSVSLVT
jgi:hypothetical protein